MAADVRRIVALGASNLTRAFRTVVSAARSTWGADVQLLVALGYGRSYGAPSRVAVRTLPGMLESGLWRALALLPEVPTRALVTDVGNDLPYGFSAEQTLAWVQEAVGRLQRVTQDIVLTDLPLASIRRLSPAKFLLCRTILFPSCRLPLARLLESAERVNTGLAELSAARGVRLFHLDPAWYGFDPIHIRPSLRPRVWQEILGARFAANGGGRPWLEGLRLSLMPPERRWLLGLERFTPQRGVALRSGGRVWLF